VVFLNLENSEELKLVRSLQFEENYAELINSLSSIISNGTEFDG